MQEMIYDAIHDTLTMLPFLYVTYVFMEYLEHRKSTKMEAYLTKARKMGPLLGAAFGIIPQCGFSVIASGLYMNGSISLGTLIAVFVSTSDEAVPILLSNPEKFESLAAIIIIKVIIAVLSGYLIDFLVKEHVLRKEHRLHNCHEHCEEEMKQHPSILYIAFMHTLKMFIFIFIINFVLSAFIYFIGEQTLSYLLANGRWFQPILASIVGFIPNCAASVLLAELYMENVLSFGALIAGLITSAGLGLLILLKMYDNRKDILRIFLFMFFIASVSGIVIQIF